MTVRIADWVRFASHAFRIHEPGHLPAIASEMWDIRVPGRWVDNPSSFNLDMLSFADAPVLKRRRLAEHPRYLRGSFPFSMKQKHASRPELWTAIDLKSKHVYIC
jgi:hypothetical protein